MSQKKRVRVYAPQVNTDHFANYMFQVGGPVGQGPMPAMQQQSQDISQDLAEILQMYAQAMGMDEQQMQQMYSAVMQMEPDQQAQAIAQMQQELNSTMAENPMVARNGGMLRRAQDGLNKNSIFYNQYLEDLKNTENYPNEEAARIMFERRNKYYNNYLRRKGEGVPEEENLKTFNQMIQCIDGQCNVPIPTYAQLDTPPSAPAIVEVTPPPTMSTDAESNKSSTPQRFRREYNPYQQTYEVMSPKQVSLLQRAYYKGEAEPDFAPELLDVITGKPVTGEELSRYVNRINIHGKTYNTQTQQFEDMSEPSMKKIGGNIKSTKKLLHKKIGGANTNMTSANVVDQRKQIIKDAIGANMARDIVNQVTEQQLSQANNMMGYAANLMNTPPRMDYGGYANAPSQSMGYRDVEDNPFYNAMENISDRVGTAWDNFGSAIGNIRMTPTNKIKVKRRGDIFKNPAQASTQPPTNEFFRQDLDTNQIPDYLQLDTAQAYNENLYPMAYGGTSSYQPGGSTYVPSSYDVAFEDLNINDEDYHRALQAYESGTHNQQQLDLINQVQNYASKIDPSLKKNMSATTTNNNPANQQTGSKGINGWYGGFFWKDGVAITSLEDVQKQQNANQSNAFNWASLFQPGNRNMTIQGNLMNLATNPEVIKKFGEGLTKFQPDNVYLSKAKGRVNPFGAKVVLKWDYDENGRPVQKEVVEEEGTSDRFSGRNLMGRMFKNSDMYSNMVQRRAERNANRFGYDTGSDESSTTSSTSTNSPTTSSTNAPLSRTSGSGMNSIYEPEITTPNPVYAPVNRSPRQTMEDIGEEEFAYGGMPKARAGKMVIKQKFKPDMGTIGQAISPTFDMVSSLLEQRDLNQMENRIYTPDVYMGSIPMGPMSMGTKGMGPLMGKENRFASNLGVTGNYGDALYQNVPGYELSGQMPYQPMGKNGGTMPMYQTAGTTDTNQVTPGEFYKYALQEKQYFLDNPETWKEDPEMQNADGSFNLCLDCLNVDYNDPATVQDVVRLINEGHSQFPHHSADVFASALQKFGIQPPTGAAPQQKKYGGSYQVGGTYELTDDEIDDIINRGGEIEYF